ncbi:MAG: hypothetical protein IPL95_08675 [Saprospiraceae bacterium]|nr:hypothetical protein [Saprospiraceae bacterium]
MNKIKITSYLFAIISLFSISEMKAQTVTITKLKQTDCYYYSNKSYTTVSMEILWSNQVSGIINVFLDTKNIKISTTKSMPQLINFEILADGLTHTITASGPSGGTDTKTILAPSPCIPLACNTNELGGIIYLDYNSNGIKDIGEYLGEKNIKINAVDKNDILYSTMSDENGLYKLNIPVANYPVRVEFSNIPNKYKNTSSVSPNGNNTMVQFVKVPSCSINLGLIDEIGYCENNPKFVTTIFRNGDPLPSGSIYGNLDVLRYYHYNENTLSAVNAGTKLANANQFGAIWGVAYDKKRNKVYSSTVVRHGSGFGPLGIGGIYVTDMTTNTSTPFLDVETLGIDVGDIGNNSVRGLFSNGNLSQDLDTWAKVCKQGIGGIDIDPNGEAIYFTNLFDKKIYKILLDADNNPTTIPTAADVTFYNIGNEATYGYTGGNMRPWALKYYNENLYVGIINDATNSQNKGDLRASILKIDIQTNTQTTVLEFPLNYTKGSPHSFWPNLGGFYPWIDDNTGPKISPHPLDNKALFLIYPEPILTEIEFDIDGSIVLAFSDRTGFQVNGRDLSANNTIISAFVGGDVLRGFKKGENYIIEYNAKAGAFTGFGANNNQGPGGGEFYVEDYSVHNENAMGGLAIKPGSGQILITQMDPYIANTNGTKVFNNTNGSTVSVITAYLQGFTQYTPNYSTAHKSIGMGDVEILCSTINTIEIGNRVWLDNDKDGIQDPDEMPIENVVIELYKDANNDNIPDGAALASTVTSVDGNWVFNNANVTEGILPNTNYLIKIANSQFNNGKGFGLLNKLLPTVANATNPSSTNDEVPGLINNSNIDTWADNDGNLFNGEVLIKYRTSSYGENNHHLDFGFYLDLHCAITNMIATPNICNSINKNNHDVAGSLDLFDAPSSGLLLIYIPNIDTLEFTPPFGNQIDFVFTNIPSNGNLNTIYAQFTALTTCNSSVSYLSPAPLTPPTLEIVNNVCPQKIGEINVVEHCGTNSFIEYSINNGNLGAFRNHFIPPFQ